MESPSEADHSSFLEIIRKIPNDKLKYFHSFFHACRPWFDRDEFAALNQAFEYYHTPNDIIKALERSGNNLGAQATDVLASEANSRVNAANAPSNTDNFHQHSGPAQVQRRKRRYDDSPAPSLDAMNVAKQLPRASIPKKRCPGFGNCGTEFSYDGVLQKHIASCRHAPEKDRKEAEVIVKKSEKKKVEDHERKRARMSESGPSTTILGHTLRDLTPSPATSMAPNSAAMGNLTRVLNHSAPLGVSLLPTTPPMNIGATTAAVGAPAFPTNTPLAPLGANWQTMGPSTSSRNVASINLDANMAAAGTPASPPFPHNYLPHHWDPHEPQRQSNIAGVIINQSETFPLNVLPDFGNQQENNMSTADNYHYPPGPILPTPTTESPMSNEGINADYQQYQHPLQTQQTQQARHSRTHRRGRATQFSQSSRGRHAGT